MMEGIPRGEAESPKAMPWQGCGCVFRMDVSLVCDGIPSECLGSFGAKRQTDTSGAEGDFPHEADISRREAVSPERGVLI